MVISLSGRLLIFVLDLELANWLERLLVEGLDEEGAVFVLMVDGRLGLDFLDDPNMLPNHPRRFLISRFSRRNCSCCFCSNSRFNFCCLKSSPGTLLLGFSPNHRKIHFGGWRRALPPNAGQIFVANKYTCPLKMPRRCGHAGWIDCCYKKKSKYTQKSIERMKKTNTKKSYRKAINSHHTKR